MYPDGLKDFIYFRYFTNLAPLDYVNEAAYWRYTETPMENNELGFYYGELFAQDPIAPHIPYSYEARSRMQRQILQIQDSRQYLPFYRPCPNSQRNLYTEVWEVLRGLPHVDDAALERYVQTQWGLLYHHIQAHIYAVCLIRMPAYLMIHVAPPVPATECTDARLPHSSVELPQSLRERSVPLQSPQQRLQAPQNPVRNDLPVPQDPPPPDPNAGQPVDNYRRPDDYLPPEPPEIRPHPALSHTMGELRIPRRESIVGPPARQASIQAQPQEPAAQPANTPPQHQILSLADLVTAFQAVNSSSRGTTLGDLTRVLPSPIRPYSRWFAAVDQALSVRKIDVTNPAVSADVAAVLWNKLPEDIRSLAPQHSYQQLAKHLKTYDAGIDPFSELFSHHVQERFLLLFAVKLQLAREACGKAPEAQIRNLAWNAAHQQLNANQKQLACLLKIEGNPTEEQILHLDKVLGPDFLGSKGKAQHVQQPRPVQAAEPPAPKAYQPKAPEKSPESNEQRPYQNFGNYNNNRQNTGNQQRNYNSNYNPNYNPNRNWTPRPPFQPQGDNRAPDQRNGANPGNPNTGAGAPRANNPFTPGKAPAPRANFLDFAPEATGGLDPVPETPEANPEDYQQQFEPLVDTDPSGNESPPCQES